MPHLSAGAHRSPRRGACFMEFASYLAGERWSDHPACTDPVLAALARGVNDNLDRRAGAMRSCVEIPRVIGLRGDDSVVGLVVALRAAIAALPVASMERQRSLALGILALRPRARRARRRDAASSTRSPTARSPMCPDAVAWATNYLAAQTSQAARSAPQRPPRRSRGSPTIGIAAACIEDPDALLIATLERRDRRRRGAAGERARERLRAESLDRGLSAARRVRVEGRDRTTVPDHHRTAPKGAAACLERTSPASKPRSAPRSSPWSRTTSRST